MIHSQIINRQKPSQQWQKIVSSRISQKSIKEECRCNATVLKLRIVNLTSQIHNLRKKIGDQQQILQKNKSYQIGFHNAVKVIKQLLSKKINEEQEMLKTNPKRQYPHQYLKQSQISTAVRTRHTKSSETQILFESIQAVINPTFSNKFQLQTSNNKIEPYQLLRELGSTPGRETLQSLQFSQDSRESLYKGDKGKSDQIIQKEELYALREEYQEQKQQLQSFYTSKIRVLTQEIEELKKQNWELLVQVKKSEQSQSQENHFRQEQPFQARETAYFSKIQTISQKEFEESIEVSDKGPSVDVSNDKNCIRSKSVSSDNWTQAAEQMRIVKRTLQKLQQMLKNGSKEVIEVLQTFYQLQKVSRKVKVISLQEYTNLLQQAKKGSIDAKRCASLQNQIQKLKKMIKELI